MKNFINKSFSLLNVFLNTFMSPRKVFNDELTKQKRLERYNDMPIEELRKKISQMQERFKDHFSPKEGLGEKLDDALLILGERELRAKELKQKTERDKTAKTAKREREIRLLSSQKERLSAN